MPSCEATTSKPVRIDKPMLIDKKKICEATGCIGWGEEHRTLFFLHLPWLFYLRSCFSLLWLS